MFGRRKKGAAGEGEQDDHLDEATEPEVEPDAPAPPPRPQGPWDQADAPDDEVNRIDLGGLLVPVPPDTEVRVDVSPEGEVVAATLVRGESAMQVNVFAAPRSYGIWSEVREEIAVALRETGGRAEDVSGPHGAELHAAVPTDLPGPGVALAPARFIGVDGPRWFLRALLTGPAATDETASADLLAALRDVVVVRGTDPMAVRDALPLRLPKEVSAAAEAAGTTEGAAGTTERADGSAQEPSLELPERGPEITERR